MKGLVQLYRYCSLRRLMYWAIYRLLAWLHFALAVRE